MNIRKKILALYEERMSKKSMRFYSDKRAAALKRYSILSVILLVIFVILLNVFFEMLINDRVKFDMSSENMNSLSDNTKMILDDLDQDIEIIGFFEEPQNLEGSIYQYFIPLLNEYVEYSNGKISVRYIDPVSNPAFIDSLDSTNQSQLSSASFVIRSDDQVRVIDNLYDCFVFDPYLLEQELYSPVFNNVETLFTGYIFQIAEHDIKTAYYLTGHGQSQMHSLERLLNYSGYNVKELYLPASETVPDDCDILFINHPSRDLSIEDKNSVLSYLRSGGIVVVALEYMPYDTEYVNLNALLEEMNMYFDDYFVHERNPSYLFDLDMTYVFKARVHEDFLFLSDEEFLIAGYSRSLFELDSPDPNIEVSTWVHTSPDAVLLYQADEVRESSFPDKYNIVMHAVNNNYSTPGQMLVITSHSFTSEEYLSYAGVNDPNAVFLKRSLEYMTGDQVPDLVSSKAFPNYRLSGLSSVNQQTFWAVFLMAIIPLTFVVGAVTVYAKRKNK